MNRTIDVTTPLGAEVLRFDALAGREALSALFDFTLTLKSARADLDPADLLGQSITVCLHTQAGVRHLNGQCARFTHLGRDGRDHRYEARLRPWLWYATRRSDCRIFQHQTVPDIVRAVLAAYPFELRLVLTRPYRAWEYCVQYRETDANFVMRLLEHEGIWFWFEHRAGEHTLVLCDDIGTASPVPGYATVPYYAPDQTWPDTDHFDAWADGGRVKPGRYLARDYHFETPRAELETVRATPADHPHARYERYEWPGGYDCLADGDPYARVRLEEAQSSQRRATGAGRARGLAPGRLFTLDRHPRAACNREYLVVAADYHLADNDYEARAGATAHAVRIAIEAHPTDRPFRPARLTPKPHTLGPETAVVVGPPGEEIHTDRYGRVKVQFHWDRYGRHDADSSCWIRVAHPWAGQGFGAIHLPRIGQEVLVDHLNGDPDQPVIVARVYNAEQMPPWALPEHRTQSGLLTRSSPGGSAEHANALRFEDQKGAEQVWLHAERNLDIEVEHDETHWVGNDRSKTIARDETTHVRRHRTETVDGNETIAVQQNRTESVAANETITIGIDRNESVGANERIAIGANRKLSVGHHDSVSIGANRSTTVGSDQSLKVSGSRSSRIAQRDTTSVGMVEMDSAGLIKMSNVGGLYSINVAGLMNTAVLGMAMEEVGTDKQIQVGDTLKINAGKRIQLTCGKSMISLDAGGNISIVGTQVHIQGQEITHAQGATESPPPPKPAATAEGGASILSGLSAGSLAALLRQAQQVIGLAQQVSSLASAISSGNLLGALGPASSLLGMAGGSQALGSGVALEKFLSIGPHWGAG